MKRKLTSLAVAFVVFAVGMVVVPASASATPPAAILTRAAHSESGFVYLRWSSDPSTVGVDVYRQRREGSGWVWLKSVNQPTFHFADREGRVGDVYSVVSYTSSHTHSERSEPKVGLPDSKQGVINAMAMLRGCSASDAGCHNPFSSMDYMEQSRYDDDLKMQLLAEEFERWEELEVEAGRAAEAERQRAEKERREAEAERERRRKQDSVGDDREYGSGYGDGSTYGTDGGSLAGADGPMS